MSDKNQTIADAILDQRSEFDRAFGEFIDADPIEALHWLRETTRQCDDASTSAFNTLHRVRRTTKGFR